MFTSVSDPLQETWIRIVDPDPVSKKTHTKSTKIIRIYIFLKKSLFFINKVNNKLNKKTTTKHHYTFSEKNEDKKNWNWVGSGSTIPESGSADPYPHH